MPTPDASAFTQFKRSNAYQNQVRTDGNAMLITHLYQPRVTVSGLKDFLPSLTNVYDTVYSRFPKTTSLKANQGAGYAAPKYIK